MTPRGLALLKAFEGIKDGDPRTVNLDPYRDSAGIWTIGWGHALRGADGKFLRDEAGRAEAYAQFPKGIDRAFAERLLQADVRPREIGVIAAVEGARLEPNQIDALVSFVFNLGLTTLKVSSLYKNIMRGVRGWDTITANFVAYNKERKCEGCPLTSNRGLTRRRKIEARLFTENVLDLETE